MVNSKFEYVKAFESEEKLLHDTFIAVSIHGSNFLQFKKDHGMLFPYSDDLIRLMAASARHVMEDFSEISIGLGQDESFVFIFKRTASLYQRRRDKVLTNVISLFGSTFVYKWKLFFPNTTLKYLPIFTGNIILLPRSKIVKEFLYFEQIKMVNKSIDQYTENIMERSGSSQVEIKDFIDNSSFGDKNELMFRHGINFNNIPPWHKRGKIIFRIKSISENSDDLNPELKGEKNFYIRYGKKKFTL